MSEGQYRIQSGSERASCLSSSSSWLGSTLVSRVARQHSGQPSSYIVLCLSRQCQSTYGACAPPPSDSKALLHHILFA